MSKTRSFLIKKLIFKEIFFICMESISTKEGFFFVCFEKLKLVGHGNEEIEEL